MDTNTGHPKFINAEIYDLTRGYYETAHTSREDYHKDIVPDDLDSDQDCDLVENKEDNGTERSDQNEKCNWNTKRESFVGKRIPRNGKNYVDI